MKIRIGIFGGVANNMYVVAKTLAKYGFDITFIRDITDWYPFSQPVWEDIPFTISYNEISKTNIFTAQYWRNVEERLNWQTPAWLVTPRIKVINPILMKILRLFESDPIEKEIMREFLKNDILLVCGIVGEILASKTGLPYFIWPHGADIRIASGIHKFNGGFIDYPVFLILRRKLERAFEKAYLVLSHDPAGIAGYLGDASPFLNRIRYDFLPIPHKERERLPRKERIKRLKHLMISVLQIGDVNEKVFDGDYLICFVPSRIDFYWKGHDILFRAISRKDFPIYLIFAGWGNDYLKALEFVEKSKNEHKVRLLDFALSKPLLYQMFDSVDIVIDQFRFGTYGTSAVEAFAGGAPVMMYINNEYFARRGWEAPQVLNVSSEDEIVQCLEDILNNKIDLEEVSKRTKQWFQRRHSEEVFINLFSKILETLR